MERSGIEVRFPSFEASSFFYRDGDEASYPDSVEQVLYPNRESIKDVLGNARRDNLTLFSDYFDHSERVSDLCILLCQRIHQARALYGVVDVLLEVPLHGDCAFDNLNKFGSSDNPFSSDGFRDVKELRCWFFQLKKQVERRPRELWYRIPLVGVATASCLPICSQRKHAKRGRSVVAQLDAAARGAYVMYNDLDTLDRLVARLDSDVENDKRLVRLGLEMERNMQLFQEVVKQLQGSRSNFMNQLLYLEEHICACFNAVNKARSLLFHELSPH